MKYTLIIILAFLLGYSYDNPVNVKDYYLPVQEFSKKKVYYFTSDNNQLNGFYWTLETSKEKKNTVFHTVILDESRKPIYEIIELVNSNGVEMKQIRVPSTQSNESYLESTVSKPKTFLWNWEKNKSIACEYSLNFESDGVQMKQIVYRQKKFLGYHDSIELFNKERSVIKFQDSINEKIINVETEKTIKETNFKQNSYWAEGIGLYRYEQPKGNLTLTEVIDFEDWEK